MQLASLQPAGNYRFDPREYKHPIVSLFRGQAQSGLLGVSISQYWRMQPSDASLTVEQVLQFDTGAPAFVVGNFGLGRVAMSALPGALIAQTDIGTPWSSFPISPSFLPFVREMMTYLIGDRWLQHRNLLVGEPAIVSASEGSELLEASLPDGGRLPVAPLGAEDGGQLTFRPTDSVGFYRFAGERGELARFAVNLDGRDSDLRSIDPATLPVGIASGLVEDIGPFAASVGEIAFARPLLGGALLLLLFEIGLAWQLGRGWG